MSLTIQNTPGTYFSVNGDLVFTCVDLVKAADPVTYPDYKYIADIYIDSIMVGRLKSVPTRVNLMGRFNIASIVRNYIAAAFNPATGLRSQELGSEEFFIDVQVKFGEEYDFTLYTNVTVDSSRTYYGHYNGRLLGTDTYLAAYVDKVATSRPQAAPIYRGSNNCFVPFLPTDTDTITLEIKRYSEGGLTGTTTATFNPAAANTLQIFNCSPAGINASTPNFIDLNVKYYTVEFQTPNISDDSLLRFDLICEGRYEVFSVHFLNRFGGFETRDFTKVSRKTIDIEKMEFGKLGYTMDASGMISYKNANNVYNETRSVYSSQYKEKMVLNTDLLTDAEYLWMADLVLSPMVYIEMNGYFLPAVVVGNNYEYKKTINDKLTNLTINLEFGEQYNAQYR